MSSDPIIAANQIGNRTRHLSSITRRIVAALHLDAADGYPAGSSGGRGPVNEISDPTFGAVNARTTGTGDGYGPADDHDLLLEQLAVMQAALDIVDTIHARRVQARAQAADRCSGYVDATCERLQPSPRHPHGVCDHCWTANRCPSCGERLIATNPPRRLQTTGERCCQPCYRNEAKAS